MPARGLGKDWHLALAGQGWGSPASRRPFVRKTRRGSEGSMARRSAQTDTLRSWPHGMTP